MQRTLSFLYRTTRITPEHVTVGCKKTLWCLIEKWVTDVSESEVSKLNMLVILFKWIGHYENVNDTYLHAILVFGVLPHRPRVDVRVQPWRSHRVFPEGYWCRRQLRHGLVGHRLLALQQLQLVRKPFHNQPCCFRPIENSTMGNLEASCLNYTFQRPDDALSIYLIFVYCPCEIFDTLNSEDLVAQNRLLIPWTRPSGS